MIKEHSIKTYSDKRHEIKSGDLLAFSHVGWNSWRDLKIQAIRLFTQSEYAHVATAWVECGRVFALEAVVPRIRIFPLSKLGDFYHIPMDIDWTEELEEYALSVVGEKYSQSEAILSFFERPPVNNLWQCCEYVRAIYDRAGVELDGKYTPTGTVQAAQRLGKPTFFVKNS